jgi:hypothetical protein
MPLFNVKFQHAWNEEDEARKQIQSPKVYGKQLKLALLNSIAA